MKRNLLTGAALIIMLAVVLPLAIGCGSSGSTGGTLPSNLAAKVGTVEITQDQFKADLTVYEGIFKGQVPDETKNPEQFQAFKAWVLDQLVMYEVVKQKAASLNVSLTDQEIEDHIAQLKKNSFNDDQSQMDAALKDAGVTLQQLHDYYSRVMLVQKAYDEVTKGVTTVSDADVSAYYDAHKDAFYQQETRTTRHILITPKSSAASTSGSTSTSAAATTSTTITEADWAAALATAQQVRADLVAGADWKTEAAKYSDDPGSKSKGGDLGTVSKGQMVAEFDKAVFSLAKDEISQPVKTVYGYHVIQVTGINPAKQQTLDEVKDQIQKKLLATEKMATWSDWIKKVKAELNVQVAPGLETTTTTAAAATSTTGGSATTAGQTVTTAGGSSTTAAPAGGTQPSTTGTTAGTATTAKP